MHRRWALIALVALSLLPLRPACDLLAFGTRDHAAVAFSLQHTAPGGVLHVSSHSSAFAVPVSEAKRAPGAAVSAIASLVIPAPVFRSRTAPPGIAPRAAKSYYARSSRILS